MVPRQLGQNVKTNGKNDLNSCKKQQQQQKNNREYNLICSEPPQNKCMHSETLAVLLFFTLEAPTTTILLASLL